MLRTTAIAFALLAGMTVTGCGNTTSSRALSGGAIGAGGGALLGAATGGNPLTGAILGGAGGAAVGALTK